MVLSSIVVFSSLAGAVDPRLDCADALATAPIRASIGQVLTLTPLALERTAIVEGTIEATYLEHWRRRLLSRRPSPSRVAVVVPPSGPPSVFDHPPRAGGLRLPLEISPGARFKVPAFGSSLERLGGGWRWDKKPRSLPIGDIPKPEFLRRYRKSVNALLGTGELTRDMLRRGIVMNARFDDQPKVVLLVGDAASGVPDVPKSRRLFVFVGDQDRLEPFYRNVWEPINLSYGMRFSRPESDWIEGTSRAALPWVLERAGHDSFRSFVREHPEALDGMWFGLRIEEATATLVRREGSQELWYMIAGPSDRDQESANTLRLLYNPSTREWPDLTGWDALIEETFQTFDGERWGLNLRGTRGWAKLPAVGEFEPLKFDRGLRSPNSIGFMTR